MDGGAKTKLCEGRDFPHSVSDRGGTHTLLHQIAFIIRAGLGRLTTFKVFITKVGMFSI